MEPTKKERQDAVTKLVNVLEPLPPGSERLGITLDALFDTLCSYAPACRKVRDSVRTTLQNTLQKKFPDARFQHPRPNYAGVHRTLMQCWKVQVKDASMPAVYLKASDAPSVQPVVEPLQMDDSAVRDDMEASHYPIPQINEVILTTLAHASGQQDNISVPAATVSTTTTSTQSTQQSQEEIPSPVPPPHPSGSYYCKVYPDNGPREGGRSLKFWSTEPHALHNGLCFGRTIVDVTIVDDHTLEFICPAQGSQTNPVHVCFVKHYGQDNKSAKFNYVDYAVPLTSTNQTKKPKIEKRIPLDTQTFLASLESQTY